MHDLKCILVAWHTFGIRKQKYQCIPSFPLLKTICRYLINNKLNYNFQLVLLFCFKMHAAGPLRENTRPLKLLLSQSQSAISPELMLAMLKGC
jgi:hypothetical protein